MNNIKYAITDQSKFSETVSAIETKNLKPTEKNQVAGKGEIHLKNGMKIKFKGITNFDKYRERFGFVLIKC